MTTLFFSMRRDGKTLGQMAREEIGPVGGAAALIAVLSLMVILLAVLALVVVLALAQSRSEEHTSELQSRQYLVCRLLLEKKKQLPRIYSESRPYRASTAPVMCAFSSLIALASHPVKPCLSLYSSYPMIVNIFAQHLLPTS